jgi:uncharacterized membrane protein
MTKVQWFYFLTFSHMTTESSVPQQDRVAAALGAILFFLPILMERKTEFTVFYMKQAFLIFVAEVALMVLVSLLWFLGPLVGLVQFILFVIVLFLVWNAWQGKKLAVPGLLENSEKLIATLKITSWFTPGK